MGQRGSPSIRARRGPAQPPLEFLSAQLPCGSSGFLNVVVDESPDLLSDLLHTRHGPAVLDSVNRSGRRIRCLPLRGNHSRRVLSRRRFRHGRRRGLVFVHPFFLFFFLFFFFFFLFLFFHFFFLFFFLFSFLEVKIFRRPLRAKNLDREFPNLGARM